MKACVWLLLPLLLLFLLRYRISLQNYEFDCIRSSQIHVLAPHKNRYFYFTVNFGTFRSITSKSNVLLQLLCSDWTCVQNFITAEDIIRTWKRPRHTIPNYLKWAMNLGITFQCKRTLAQMCKWSAFRHTKMNTRFKTTSAFW